MKLERLGSGWIRGGLPPSPAESDIRGVGASAAVGMGGGGAEGTAQGMGGSAGELSEVEIEERELVEWASLKECQIKFMRENGLGGLM